MRTRIKICGLMDSSMIRQMNGLPVNEIGLVFAKSRRQVSAEQAVELVAAAADITGAENKRPRTVGVFVNADTGELDRLLPAAPLDVVQLHGQESPELCRTIKDRFEVEVWKVFSVAPHDDKNAALLKLEPYAGTVDAVLIDTAGGGTGEAFDWTVIDGYKEAAAQIGVPLYVAGGLHPDNIGELIKSYRPDGVDVSSGVETDGVKDFAKIKAFVERVGTA
ncbi:phosphoribosylanthranilate isomerase [Paenibacillus sambharensis]|uniref:N-(5'-phosphoribosyl)anthranilate isomerase n=1 Tax=Paenibacillus sambharensis TaxID=1803190 RepID=A0A2W1L608_9BACL|nr:phosphoribosylanthranilate isomerase [Paenibacillus sambharensis]PZD93540.1 phosphoribosylanthranilate isomerase [Paenibacillus sambharensis]